MGKLAHDLYRVNEVVNVIVDCEIDLSLVLKDLIIRKST